MDWGLTALEAEAAWLSIMVSFAAIIIGLPLALGAAWMLTRLSFPGKWLFNALVHAPLVVPPVVIGYILLVVLSPGAPLGQFLSEVLGLEIAFSWKGAALASGVMAFPLMVRAIRISLEAIDRGLEDAARTLGAGPVDVFTSVTLPMITPGLLAAAILGFARALGEFGATITFVASIPGETRTLPLALYELAQTPGGEAGALRVALISLAIAIAALAASEFLARKFRGGAR